MTTAAPAARAGGRADTFRPLAATFCWAILGLALLARLIWLDNLPGLNGDEAWYGLWAEHLVRGEVWSWRTPTGNPVNPFLLLPLTLLQSIASPSPWVLRLPAALSGVAFIAIGYACLSRTENRTAAAIFALIAAALPTAIAYSRFGWDASQTPLATAIFVYCCVARRLWWAALASVAAIVVHPTNVFLLPIFAAFLAEAAAPAVARVSRGGTVWLLPAVLIGGALLTIPVALQLRSGASDQLWAPQYWLLTILLFADLFSGVTVYRFISGGAAALALHRATSIAILCGTAIFWLRSRREPRADPFRTLAAGLATAILCFAIVVGPAGLLPNWERYAQLFLAPVLILAAVALSRARGGTGAGAVSCAAACACLGLGSVWVNYFEPLRDDGGAQPKDSPSYWAFHTAGVEPKAAVAQWLADNARDRPAIVQAEGWWLSKPLQYLLADRAAVTAAPLDASQSSDGAIVVVFADGLLDRQLKQAGVAPAYAVANPDGTPFIRIYRPTPAPSR
jgi:hypothetical protein